MSLRALNFPDQEFPTTGRSSDGRTWAGPASSRRASSQRTTSPTSPTRATRRPCTTATGRTRILCAGVLVLAPCRLPTFRRRTQPGWAHSRGQSWAHNRVGAEGPLPPPLRLCRSSAGRSSSATRTPSSPRRQFRSPSARTSAAATACASPCALRRKQIPPRAVRKRPGQGTTPTLFYLPARPVCRGGGNAFCSCLYGGFGLTCELMRPESCPNDCGGADRGTCIRGAPAKYGRPPTAAACCASCPRSALVRLALTRCPHYTLRRV